MCSIKNRFSIGDWVIVDKDYVNKIYDCSVTEVINQIVDWRITPATGSYSYVVYKVASSGEDYIPEWCIYPIKVKQ